MAGRIGMHPSASLPCSCTSAVVEGYDVVGDRCKDNLIIRRKNGGKSGSPRQAPPNEIEQAG